MTNYEVLASHMSPNAMARVATTSTTSGVAMSPLEKLLDKWKSSLAYVENCGTQPDITVYTFGPRPGHSKNRHVWCRDGRVMTAGPDVEDAIWALTVLETEVATRAALGRIEARRFSIVADVLAPTVAL